MEQEQSNPEGVNPQQQVAVGDAAREAVAVAAGSGDECAPEEGVHGEENASKRQKLDDDNAQHQQHQHALGQLQALTEQLTALQQVQAGGTAQGGESASHAAMPMHAPTGTPGVGLHLLAAAADSLGLGLAGQEHGAALNAVLMQLLQQGADQGAAVASASTGPSAEADAEVRAALATLAGMLPASLVAQLLGTAAAGASGHGADAPLSAAEALAALLPTGSQPATSALAPPENGGMLSAATQPGDAPWPQSFGVDGGTGQQQAGAGQGPARPAARRRQGDSMNLKVTFEGEGLRLSDGRIHMPLAFVAKNFPETEFPIDAEVDLYINEECIKKRCSVKMLRYDHKSQTRCGNHWITGHQRYIKNYKDVRLLALEMMLTGRLKILMSANGTWTLDDKLAGAAGAGPSVPLLAAPLGPPGPAGALGGGGGDGSGSGDALAVAMMLQQLAPPGMLLPDLAVLAQAQPGGPTAAAAALALLGGGGGAGMDPASLAALTTALSQQQPSGGAASASADAAAAGPVADAAAAEGDAVHTPGQLGVAAALATIEAMRAAQARQAEARGAAGEGGSSSGGEGSGSGDGEGGDLARAAAAVAAAAAANGDLQALLQACAPHGTAWHSGAGGAGSSSGSGDAGGALSALLADGVLPGPLADGTPGAAESLLGGDAGGGGDIAQELLAALQDASASGGADLSALLGLLGGAGDAGPGSSGLGGGDFGPGRGGMYGGDFGPGGLRMGGGDFGPNSSGMGGGDVGPGGSALGGGDVAGRGSSPASAAGGAGTGPVRVDGRGGSRCGPQPPRLYDGRVHVPLVVMQQHFSDAVFPLVVSVVVVINQVVVADNVSARIVRYKKHKRPDHFNFWITGLQKTLQRFNDVRQAGVFYEAENKLRVNLLAAS
ncbi:hypothetical protein FOA52_005303 [Chlamydomonas sp. UWO 241]|nr:hypothetical protein FOA52_005303 [Chlamydomonas sp. UWO 241]